MNKYLLGLSVCVSVCLPYSAMAGFQFTAPIAEQPIQPTQSAPIQGGLLPDLPSDTPMMPSAPQIQVQTQAPSAPLIVSPEPMPAPAPVPVIVTMPEQVTAPTPVIEYSAPTNIGTAPLQLSRPAPDLHDGNTSAGLRQPAPMKSTPSTPHNIAVGFGNDIPLTTALRQIVPTDYAYVVDQNIDGEQFVTWNGGREWTLVLNDMIQPLGLTSSIDGQVVRITSGTQAQENVTWNVTPATSTPVAIEPAPQPQVPAVAPMNIVPASQPSAPSMMELEEIEAKAVESLPTPPSHIIMQDFQTPQPPIVSEVSEGQWRAQNGDSLRTVIESWANIEGVDLFWSSEFDYKLAGDVNISGNFEQAIETLLSGFSEAQPRPTGRLHPNLPHGPAVLVVETRQKSS